MTDNPGQKRARQKYEQKRQGMPRYNGYLTPKQKGKFSDTVKLGGFSSEKEMLIAAVDELHKKLSK